MDEEDVALSFLPLSHAFERMVCYVYLLCGVTLIFAESLETIGRDVPVVKPTVFTGVRASTRSCTPGSRKRGSPIRGEERDLPLGCQRRHGARTLLSGRRPSPLLALQSSLADRLVFSKIRNGVGGRLATWCRGGAARRERRRVLHGLGLPIIEGYGLTETADLPSIRLGATRRHGRGSRHRRRATHRRRR